MWRRGGYFKLPTTELFNLSKQLLVDTTGGYGMGIGLDAGIHYFYFLNPYLSLGTGVAITDIGDTAYAGRAQSQRSTLAAGIGLKYKRSLFSFTLSYDYRHILQKTDWRQRNHLGAELAFPLLSIYGGVNQVYFSYGVGINLIFMKLYVISYGQELGTLIHQEPDRRYLIGLDFKFNL